VVEDDRPGDDQVGSAFCPRGPPLAHRLPDHLAAAEHRLLPSPSRSAGEVVGDLDEQVGVGQPDPVAGGRAVELGVPLAADLDH
jgi:hypothetical protein